MGKMVSNKEPIKSYCPSPPPVWDRILEQPMGNRLRMVEQK